MHFGKRSASNLPGLARVAALVGLLATVALGFGVRSASARVGEVLRSVGLQMAAELDGADYDSEPRELTINGVTFHLVTASVSRDLPEVLDVLEASCRGRAGVEGTERLVDVLEQKASFDPAGALSLLDPVHRFESAREGTVACLDTGGSLGVGELLRRIREMLETGDLNSVGELRYAFARRTDEGTHLLLLWTEGAARILEMFPPKGDAPGHDPAEVPRLPGTRRLLSAQEHGTPYVLTLYAAPGAPDAVARFYERELARRGFLVERISAGASKEAFLARRGERLFFIRSAASKDQQTIVSINTLG